MKGLAPLVLGIFGTFAFSWAGLILIPNYQIGHLDPQTDEDGNDPYPAPKSGMAERGRQIYAANGCVYCHSQQVRADYAGSDLERTRDVHLDVKPTWGTRRSAPRDYLFERPVLLGKMRLGPDLANIGKSAPAETESVPAAAPPVPAAAGTPVPSAAGKVAPGPTPAAAAVGSPTPAAGSTPTSPPAASPTPVEAAPGDAPPKYSVAWHHRHLYSPRSLVLDSNMPAYHFLYEKRRVGGQVAADALRLATDDVASERWEIVPTYDARCLVAYLMSLDQSHALNEVRGTAPSVPAPAKETK